MCSTDRICEQKKDMDDSGLVFDMSAQDGSTTGAHFNLLDLSDDVLLYILRFCPPRDLKALGHSCSRLGSLVLERSLWRHVDARAEGCSYARLQWMLDHALHADTHALLLTGFARESEGCMGVIHTSRKAAEEELAAERRRDSNRNARASTCAEAVHEMPLPLNVDRRDRQLARFYISSQRSPLNAHRCLPSWPWEDGRAGPDRCKGPQFTMSTSLLHQLLMKCPQLHTLGLEHCNIDNKAIGLSIFPKTLKKLSLRGTRCYNMTFDKSFLFKIQECLPLLESLDVSECDWMDPATLLPLSKLKGLEELILQDCAKLTEFVAYASLTARYGFKALKNLDLRGSPVGDSEVSALGWLPQLERLWLSARRQKYVRPHAHFTDDEPTPHAQLHDWEDGYSEEFATTQNSNPDTSVEDMECGTNEAASSSGITKEDPRPSDPGPSDPGPSDPGACEPGPSERPQSKDSQGNLGGADENDKKDGKRKPDDDDDSDDQPCCKRRRTGVKISFENNTVTKKILPVIRNENGFFVFDETEEAGNGDNANENQGNDNENRDNENPDSEHENCCNDNENQGNDNENRGNDNEDQGNDNENNINRQGNGQGNNGVNMVPPNFQFNLINPRGSIDVGNVEIDFSVVNVEQNANGNVNPEVNRNNANRNFRYRYQCNENRENEANGEDDRNSSECIVNCIKIDQLIDVSEASAGRQNEVIVIASSTRPKSDPSLSRQNQQNMPANCVHFRQNQSPEGKQNDDNDEKSESNDNDNQQNEDDIDKPGPSDKDKVNEGASTSKEDDKAKYVRFRKNKDPVYVNCAPEANAVENDLRRDVLPPVQYQIEPRHHVLYVGVGSHLNTYRFPRDSSELLRHLHYRPAHVDASGLVTDFAMRRFGRAEVDDINIIHIGPDGPMVVGQPAGSRPDRSNLRFLSVTGYRQITDRSLIHLATAAPNLEFIDFSGTGVTEHGVARFRSLRSDCEIVFNKEEENK